MRKLTVILAIGGSVTASVTFNIHSKQEAAGIDPVSMDDFICNESIKQN